MHTTIILAEIPFINYPGSIAATFSDLIKVNPSFFLISWQLLSILFVLALTGLIFLNFSESDLSKSAFIKIIKSSPFYLLFSIAGIFVLRLPNFALPEQNMDESQWIVNAATWLSGALVWKDVSGLTGGPLLYVPLSILYYAGEGLNYGSIRFFGIVCCIIPSVIFLFLAFKKLFNHSIASLIVFPLTLFFSFSNSKDFIAYNSELVPMLLMAVSFYFFISWQIKNSLLKLFVLGFILGCFPYAKLQAVPVALAMVVCTIVELIISKNKTTKQKTNAVLLFISGGMLPSALLLIYLLQNGIFTVFINDYIIQNLSYTQTGLAYHITGIAKLFIPIIIIKETPELLAYFVSIGILIIACASVLYKNRNRISGIDKRKIIYSVFLFVAAYFSVCLPGSYYYHYATLLLIPANILLALLTGISFPFFKEKISSKKIILSFLIIATIPTLYFTLKNGNSGMAFIRNGGRLEISEVSKEISKYSIPNEKLTVWGWNHKFYVETGLIQGTPSANSFYEVSSALQNDYAALEKYISNMQLNQPVIFLDATQPEFIGFKNQEGLGHENFLMLKNYISKNYTLVSTINEKKIYVLNERLMQMGIL